MRSINSFTFNLSLRSRNLSYHKEKRTSRAANAKCLTCVSDSRLRTWETHSLPLPGRLCRNAPFSLRRAQGKRLSYWFSICRCPFVVSLSNHEWTSDTVSGLERAGVRENSKLQWDEKTSLQFFRNLVRWDHFWTNHTSFFVSIIEKVISCQHVRHIVLKYNWQDFTDVGIYSEHNPKVSLSPSGRLFCTSVQGLTCLRRAQVDCASRQARHERTKVYYKSNSYPFVPSSSSGQALSLTKGERLIMAQLPARGRGRRCGWDF